jgi:2-succinyl-6-hydroxy-2,4-cyclohexadiene-1-carboxylate synthase
VSAPRAEAVALVHGFLGGPASWDAVLDAWRPERPVVRLSVLGHAPEPAPGEAEVRSFDDEIARHLARLRGTLGDARCALVGYSLGARLALGLVATAPERFGHVTLVSGRDGLEDPDEARARAELDDALARTLAEEGLPSFVARWEALPLFATQAALPADRRAAHRARRLAHEPRGLARALSTLSLGRMPRYASRARGRVASVVVGEHDAKFRGLAGPLAGTLGARVEVVAGAGHDVPLERPEALASILRGAAR